MTLSEKIAGVADQSAIESLIKQGEYAKSEQDVEKLIANLRDLEAAYEDAILASLTVVREEERLTERGVVFSSKKAEVDVLIVEGAYDKVVRRSAAIIKEYLKRESAWLKAQEIVVILGSEVERVTEKGIVIPESFDIASVGVLMYEGEYAKAGQRAKSLIQKIRALENTFNDASGLFALLIRERNRLDEKGVPLPETADPSPIKVLLDAGDYKNAAVGAQEILDLLKALEAAYDRAMQMADLLGSEISRVGEKGVVLPAGISLEPVLDAIDAGDFDGAVDAASDLIQQIREIEADYDRAVDLAGQVRDGSERLNGLGVSIPFDPSEIDDLITAGRYDEAIARAHGMLKDLDGLEAERLLNERSIKVFQDELDREIGRLKDRGIIVPYNTDTLASLIDTEEDEKAWEEAGNLLTGLRDLENLYDAAKRAQDRLVTETKRIREDGIVVPDYTGEVAKQMAAGDYRKAWETAGDRLLAILLIERDALDARAALDQLRAEIARLKKKGVVIADESNLVENLIGEGKTAAAKKAAASQLQHHLMIEGRFDAALAALKNSEEKKKQLLNKGVIVPEVPAAIGDLMNNGAYSDALDAVRSFVALLIAADNQYNAAIAALKALSDELSRVQKKGVLVPDNRTAVEALISDGKYLPAQEQVRTEILLIRSLESGYGVARKARKALAERLASLKKKGVVVPFDLVATDALLENGDYSGAIAEMHVLAKNLSATEHAFDTAQNALKTLKSEIARLTQKGLVVPESLSAVKDLITSGKYPQAQKKAETAIRMLVVLESAYDGALEALAALKKEIARLKNKGVVIADESNLVENLIGEGKIAAAKEAAASQLQHHLITEGRFDASVAALKDGEEKKKQLLNKGVIVPEVPAAIGDLMNKGAYFDALDAIRSFVALLIVADTQYNAAIVDLKALSDELSRLQKKGVLVPDNRKAVEALISDGKYLPAQEQVRTEILLLRSLESGYDVAQKARKALAERLVSLKKKGVVVPFDLVATDALLEKGDYSGAIAEVHVLAKNLSATEHAYDEAQNALKTLKSEVARLTQKGLIVPKSLSAVKNLIKSGIYPEAQKKAEMVLRTLVVLESAYDGALEALAALKKEIVRLTKKGVLVPDRTGVIEDLIGAGKYHEAWTGAYDEIVSLRVIEQEYDNFTHSMGVFASETDRLLTMGVKITDEHLSVQKMADDGNYQKAIFRIGEVLDSYRLLEFEFESAQDAIALLNKEIARLKKKGVVVSVSPGPTESLIAEGEYRKAREEANLLISDLRATESLFDSAIEALSLLTQEITRLKKKGVVIPENTTEVQKFIEKGEYHTARSTAEVTISELRRIESDYNAAIEALKGLKKEMARIKSRGIIMSEITDAVTQLIENGSYSASRSEVSAIIQRLKKVEIAYESALEALTSLEQEIARIQNMGVLLPVTTRDVTTLLASGAYGEAVSMAEKIHKQVRNIEIEYTTAIDALGDLVAEIERLHEKGVIIDDDITVVHLTIEKGSYVQARTMAEDHLSVIRAAEIEYDSALSTLAELKTEIQRLRKKSVHIDADTGPVEKLIKIGAYRKAKDQADSHLSALKKTEREYDSAIGALEQVQAEIERLVQKGVVITEDVGAIQAPINEGAYKKATTVADKMQGRLRERESDYDAAIGSLKSYLREQGRVAENGVPVPEESAAIQTYIEVGEYAQARSEAEALVSRVKSFEWEYELTMSAYESLKTEVERLKAQGIVITDDPAQVEEFIENGQYQNAKSISEGLLSKIKTTEWEYGLAKKALEALEREMVSGKKGKKGVKVDTEGIKATIREGRYRKAKSMAEELISTLRS